MVAGEARFRAGPARAGSSPVERLAYETRRANDGSCGLFVAALLVVVGMAVAVVVFGFVLAPGAGRGSRNAFGWWIFIVALESHPPLPVIEGGDA